MNNDHKKSVSQKKKKKKEAKKTDHTLTSACRTVVSGAETYPFPVVQHLCRRYRTPGFFPSHFNHQEGFGRVIRRLSDLFIHLFIYLFIPIQFSMSRSITLQKQINQQFPYTAQGRNWTHNPKYQEKLKKKKQHLYALGHCELKDVAKRSNGTTSES